ncbi:MAG: hypothetical protein AB1589_44330 [Cyanobacteriota bacterium]
MQARFNPSLPDFQSAEWKFTKSAEELPKMPGLYAIYSDDTCNTCLYVGKTINSLRARVVSCAHRPWRMAVELFKSPSIRYRVLLSASETEFYFQECLAIAVLRPQWNNGGIQWRTSDLELAGPEGFLSCSLGALPRYLEVDQEAVDAAGELL